MKPNQTWENFDKIADVKTLTTLRLLGINNVSFNSIQDDISLHLWIHDGNNIIVYENQSFTKNFGTCLKQKCHQCLMGEKTVCNCCLSKKSAGNKKSGWCRLCKRGTNGYDMNIFHTPTSNNNEHNFILHSSLHVTDLNIMAENLYPEMPPIDEEKKILVMCAACKRARDEKNNWVTVDSQILDYFMGRVSHGICPECVKILYPWMDTRDLQENITSR